MALHLFYTIRGDLHCGLQARSNGHMWWGSGAACNLPLQYLSAATHHTRKQRKHESPSDFAGHTEFSESSRGRSSTWARVPGPQIGGQRSISPQQFISISGGTIGAGLQLGLRCDLLQVTRDLDAGAGLQHMHIAARGNLESG